MLILIAGIFIALSVYSLYTTMLSWKAVRSGLVHIDVIRDLTGRVDRDEITRLFGQPDASLYYPVTPELIKKNRAPFCFLLSCEGVDILNITLLGLALYEGSTPLGWAIVSASGLFIMAGYLLAAYLIAAHIEQLEDEIATGLS